MSQPGTMNGRVMDSMTTTVTVPFTTRKIPNSIKTPVKFLRVFSQKMLQDRASRICQHSKLKGTISSQEGSTEEDVS